MNENRSTIDRRTVLKATGAAAIAPVGIAATAAADHVEEGDCVRILYDVQSYGPGCLDDNPQAYFEAGDKADVLKTCTDNDGVDKVHVINIKGEGWIPDDYVEPC